MFDPLPTTFLELAEQIYKSLDEKSWEWQIFVHNYITRNTHCEAASTEDKFLDFRIGNLGFRIQDWEFMVGVLCF